MNSFDDNLRANEPFYSSVATLKQQQRWLCKINICIEIEMKYVVLHHKLIRFRLRAKINKYINNKINMN